MRTRSRSGLVGLANAARLGGGRAAAGICDVSRRWRKVVAVSAQPAALQLWQSRRDRGWARDICAMPAQGRSRIDSVAATPSAVQGDAARGAIDAARARMIDRRGSVVTAEPDEELFAAATDVHFTKVCPVSVPFRRPRVSPPPPVLTFDTANLEARATPPGVAVWRV